MQRAAFELMFDAFLWFLSFVCLMLISYEFSFHFGYSELPKNCLMLSLGARVKFSNKLI